MEEMRDGRHGRKERETEGLGRDGGIEGGGSDGKDGWGRDGGVNGGMNGRRDE